MQCCCNKVWYFFVLRKFPDLYKWFKDFLGYKESGSIEPVPQGATGKERISSDLAMEIGEFKHKPKKYGFHNDNFHQCKKKVNIHLIDLCLNINNVTNLWRQCWELLISSSLKLHNYYEPCPLRHYQLHV